MARTESEAATVVDRIRGQLSNHPKKQFVRLTRREAEIIVHEFEEQPMKPSQRRNRFKVTVMFKDGTETDFWYPTQDAADLAATGFRMSGNVAGVR